MKTNNTNIAHSSTNHTYQESVKKALLELNDKLDNFTSNELKDIVNKQITTILTKCMKIDHKVDTNSIEELSNTRFGNRIIEHMFNIAEEKSMLKRDIFKKIDARIDILSNISNINYPSSDWNSKEFISPLITAFAVWVTIMPDIIDSKKLKELIYELYNERSSFSEAMFKLSLDKELNSHKTRAALFNGEDVAIVKSKIAK